MDVGDLAGQARLRKVAEAAVDCFTRAVRVSGAVMYRVTPELHIGEYLVKRVRPDTHNAYAQGYWALDPLAPRSCLQAPRSLLTLGRVLPLPARPASRYYREFLQRFGIRDAIEIMMRGREGDVFGISLLRDARAGEFSAEEIDTCLSIRQLTELALPACHERDAANSVRSGVGVLSQREREIAELVVQGMTNKEICFACHAALSTVKNHLQRIFEKLQVRNRAQLVARWTDCCVFDRLPPTGDHASVRESTYARALTSGSSPPPSTTRV